MGPLITNATHALSSNPGSAQKATTPSSQALATLLTSPLAAGSEFFSRECSRQPLSRRQEAASRVKLTCDPSRSSLNCPEWTWSGSGVHSQADTPLYVFSQNDEKDVWSVNRSQRMVL